MKITGNRGKIEKIIIFRTMKIVSFFEIFLGAKYLPLKKS